MLTLRTIIKVLKLDRRRKGPLPPHKDRMIRLYPGGRKPASGTTTKGAKE